MERKTSISKEKSLSVMQTVWGLIILASFLVLCITGGMNKAMQMCGWYSAPYSLRIAVPILLILSSLVIGGTAIVVSARGRRKNNE